jgi:predicted site-specific integrase-resolvase
MKRNVQPFVELLKAKQAAEIVGCRPATLTVYRRKGKLIEEIHYIRRSPTVVRYCKEELCHWARYGHIPGEHEAWLKARALESLSH